MSKRLLPLFSSRILLISHLTFRFFIHFEFIFVYGIRKCSTFILLYVVIQFSQHHLLKRLSFSHWIFFLLCQRVVDHRVVCPFLFFFYSVPLIYVSVVPVPQSCLQLCNIAWSLKLWCLQLCSSFPRLLCLLEVFCGFIQILGLLGLALWKMLVVFW